MKIQCYTRGITSSENDTVIALGFFDGVHLGHRKLIKEAKEIAEREGLPLAVFTFSSESFTKKGRSIYTTEERLLILEGLGVDEVYIASFDELRDVDAEDFAKGVLIGDLGAKCAVFGRDFRYGKDRLGTKDTLAKDLANCGSYTHVVDDEMADGEKISTSRIKALLGEGMAEEAARLLGLPYFEMGKTERGLGLGRSLGVPTVNFNSDASLLRHGVYRTATLASGKAYHSITNVGTCPTFGERERHQETFIIDFDGDLYDKDLCVFYLGYLREETRFDSENEFKMQINIDKNKAISENGDIKWLENGLNLQ